MIFNSPLSSISPLGSDEVSVQAYCTSLLKASAFYSDGTILNGQLLDKSVNARHATISNNIVTDPGAELGSTLIAWNTATVTNSDEQAHSGTKSFKCVVTGASTVQGAKSQPFRTRPGEVVNYSFWIYPTVYTAGTIRLQVIKGDGSVGYQNLSATPTLNQWNEISGSFTDTVGGGAGEIRFYVQTGNLTVYLDDLSITITGKTNIGVAMADVAALKTIDKNNLFYTAAGIPKTIRNDVGDPTIWNTKLFCGGTNKWAFFAAAPNVKDRWAIDKYFTDHDWIFDSCEVVKTVGSGKDYATIQAAIDSFTTGTMTNRCRIAVYDSFAASVFTDYAKTVFTTYKDIFALDKAYCYLDGIGDITVQGTLADSESDANMALASIFDVYGSGGARNIKFKKTNGRYVVHCDTTSNENADIVFKGCEFHNYGMDSIVAYRNANLQALPGSSTGGRDAWGCGVYTGTISRFSGCTFTGIFPYRSHNGSNLVSNVFFYDCTLTSMPIYNPTDNPTSAVKNPICLTLGNGTGKSLCYAEKCTLNAANSVSDGWTLTSY
jgi:hypothetical protein